MQENNVFHVKTLYNYEEHAQDVMVV